MTDGILLSLLILGACVWVGGYVTVAVVTRVARRTVPEAARVSFHRELGRSFARVSVAALAVAVATGAALLIRHGTTSSWITPAVITVLIVIVLAVAIGQARGLTRMRQAAVDDPAQRKALHERIKHTQRRAAILRAVLGLLSVALVINGAFLAT